MASIFHPNCPLCGAEIVALPVSARNPLGQGFYCSSENCTSVAILIDPYEYEGPND